MRFHRLASLLLASGYIVAAPALRVSEADAKKAAIEKPAPVYPMMARQLKLTGTIAVEATVNEAGTVEDVKVPSGNPILGKAAVEAVRKWRFKPFQVQGKPSPAVVTLSFEFFTH